MLASNKNEWQGNVLGGDSFHHKEKLEQRGGVAHS
jgi:hypothetical protein